MTLLIASIFVESVEEAAARSESAWKQGADAVELRIDRFVENPADLAAFLRRHPDRKWIVTCRSASEGGRCADDAEARARRVADAVRGSGAIVDFEAADWQARPEVVEIVETSIGKSEPTPRLILSAHDSSSSPADVDGMIRDILHSAPSVIAKAAHSGTTIHDSFVALDAMRAHGTRAIALCMGEHGSWTRILARKLGAFASYAAESGESGTAPGQWTIDELVSVFRWRKIDPKTKMYGVIGDPVAHSVGPLLFNRWFAQFGINAVYLPLLVSPDCGGIAQFLDECVKRPWLDVGGFSVTIPHKRAALDWAGDAADPMSIGIGATNTLCLGPGGIAAYNTDCYAAISSLTDALGCDRSDLADVRVDVLGAGGAASAVLYGLREFGCRAMVFGRSEGAAKKLAERFSLRAVPWGERLSRSGEVVINCTPIGMWPDVHSTPLPIDALHGCRLVFDLIYRPLRTRFLSDAESIGCATLNGLDMFVRQATTQFELWTGASPNVDDARSFLQDALTRAESTNASKGRNRRSIALIGLRGSGKSTVGRELARLLGGECVDTDELIAREAGRSITTIFDEEGESGFRAREARVIRRNASAPPAVISVGGGAVLDQRNVEALKAVATIVWLTAPVDVLRSRIETDPSTVASRPGLTGAGIGDEIKHLAAERESFHQNVADVIIDTSNATPEQIAREIVTRLRSNEWQD